jgi:hypothetical protein
LDADPFSFRRTTWHGNRPTRRASRTMRPSSRPSHEKKWLNGWYAGATSRSYAGMGMRLFLVFRDFRYWHADWSEDVCLSG